MDLKKELKNRDRIIKVLSKDGLIRASIIKNSKAAQTAQNTHNMPAIPAIYSARALSAASLLATHLKGEERVIINASGNSLLQTIYAEAMPVGEVRSFARYNANIDSAEISEIKDLMGDGLFKVIKVLYDRPEPQTGIIKLVNGDISSELEEYLNNSEQISSASVLDVSLEGTLIKHSGGLLLQALPGAKQEDVFRSFDALQAAQPISQLLEQGYYLEDILKIILPFNYDVIATAPIDFFCRCSKDSFKSKLLTLHLKELTDMKKQGHNELVCQYCSKKYYLDDNDFDEIIHNALAKNN